MEHYRLGMNLEKIVNSYLAIHAAYYRDAEGFIYALCGELCHASNEDFPYAVSSKFFKHVTCRDCLKQLRSLEEIHRSV